MDKEFKVVDLTQTISPEVPTFDGDCGFKLSMVVDYKDCTEPNLFRVQKLEAKAGIGTHIDAPAHCVPGGKTIEGLELENLVVDCAVIRVEDKADENYVIMPSVIEDFEKEHGKISANTFVLFSTGWDRFWNTPEKYINKDNYPSINTSTAELLLSRNIAGIGTDTLSADRGGQDFPVHRAVLSAGKYLVENITNIKDLPSVGAKVVVLPIKIKDATEAPVRIIALS